MSPTADRAPWPTAARDLARRVERRRRAGALLRALAAGLFAGAILATAARLAGSSPKSAAALLVVGGLLGTLLGLRAAGRSSRVASGDAAWALDRIAGARERGLTAAEVAGPAGAEAAWAGAPLVPPRVRLLPPSGLVPAILTALLAATVLSWPAQTRRGPRELASERAPRRGAGAAAEAALEAGRRGADAEAAAREAAAERGVRDALGLPETGRVDASELAARLAQKDVLARARAAASAGSAVAGALQSGGPEAAQALAHALEADPSGSAEALWRDAATLSTASVALPIPPFRRALVARYLAARIASGPVESAGSGAK